MTPTALTEIEGRKIPTAWRIAIPSRFADDRVHPAESAEAGWERAFPIGKARSASRAATRVRLSGDDRLLRSRPSFLEGDLAMLHYTALVTCLAILFYFFTTIQVSKARVAFGIKAPAISGNPDFERVFRVQMNTLEWMPIFLPSLWLFAIYISDPIAAALGLVWIAGRILYMTGYSQAARKRGRGFAIQAGAAVLLWLGALGRDLLAPHSSMKAGVNRDPAFSYSEAIEVSDASGTLNT